jgi:hypothetical protein
MNPIPQRGADPLGAGSLVGGVLSSTFGRSLPTMARVAPLATQSLKRGRRGCTSLLTDLQKFGAATALAEADRPPGRLDSLSYSV